MNPCNVSLKASKKDSFCIIDVSIKVKCNYPQNSYVTLLSKPELRVEEGLFWILQQAGWLFPYTVDWKFVIYSNDEKIKNSGPLFMLVLWHNKDSIKGGSRNSKFALDKGLLCILGANLFRD